LELAALVEECSLMHAKPSRSFLLYVLPTATAITAACNDSTVLLQSRPPAARNVAPRSWVTLLVGDSANSTAAVEVQILSVQQFSVYPHITMVTPDVDNQSLVRLREKGSIVVPINYVNISWSLPSYWSGVFSKVYMFNLTTLAQQVAYLDTDAFLVDEEADSVFAACAAELCAVRDFGELSSAGMINVGVLVARTSKERFRDMLKAASEAKPALFPEQDFFSTYFSTYSIPPKDASVVSQGMSFQQLPPVYNNCNGAFESTSSAVIAHACGDMKLEMLPLCSWATPASRLSGFCGSRMVRVFQRLLTSANPCAVFGQSAVECDSKSQCQWCGEIVRCRSRQSTCMLSTPATAGLVTRFQSEPRSRAWLSNLMHAVPPSPDVVARQYPVSHPPAALASLMVLTCNRHAFLRLALQQIASQDYRELEAVIVDDGPEPIELALRPELRQEHGSKLFSWEGLAVQLVRLQQQMSIGQKRNEALWAAKGKFIVHWDDDDLYPPWRVRLQLQPIAQGRAQLTTLPHTYFSELPNGTFFKYAGEKQALFLGSLAYQRDMALKLGGFADVSKGEDFEFTERALMSCRKLIAVDEPSVYVRHNGGARNSWKWSADISHWLYGWNPSPVDPPEFVTSAILAESIAAEADAGRHEGCTLKNAVRLPIKLTTWPLMPTVCCASVDDPHCAFADSIALPDQHVAPQADATGLRPLGVPKLPLILGSLILVLCKSRVALRKRWFRLGRICCVTMTPPSF